MKGNTLMVNTKALERLLAFTAEWRKRRANGDTIYGLGLHECTIELTASDIETVCSQLAERDAQLAAERAIAARLVEGIEHQQECERENWDLPPGKHRSSLKLRSAIDSYKATRQPTQDEGK